ncbi:hypothetical protein Bca101_060823 [Brassica carinata]
MQEAPLSSPIPEEFENISEISTTVHCDGLLLCRCNETRTKRCKLAVWNPFLKRIKWIKPMSYYSDNDFYGIGYDNVSRDEYKILRIFEEELEDDESSVIGPCEPVIQLYDFKTNAWRIIVDEATTDWSIDPPCKGVSIKGNMYWVAHWNKKPELFILCFDFSSETFRVLCNVPFQCSVLDTASLSIFRGDRLSLLHQREETTKIAVWVTDTVNADVVSCEKYLNVTNPDLPTLHTDHDLAHPSYFVGKNDSIVAWCEEVMEGEADDCVCVSVYEISKDGIARKVVDTGRCNLSNYDRLFVCGFLYLPSLVPVPE